MLIKHRILIKHHKVFELLQKEGVSKIELKHGDNATLKDPLKVKAVVYYKGYKNEICTVIGACEKAREILPNTADVSGFLAGVMGMKEHHSIKASTILRLNGIEQEYGVNLSISRRLFRFARYLKDQQEN